LFPKVELGDQELTKKIEERRIAERGRAKPKGEEQGAKKLRGKTEKKRGSRLGVC